MRAILISTIMISLLCCACGANDAVLRSGKETPTQTSTTSPKSPFARDLDDMQTAEFVFVYVLRRKDGQPMDKEDRSVVRANTTDVNRRTTADDDRAVIIGSNYKIPEKNMLALNERFAVEDHSPAPTPEVSNSNANK